MKKWKCTVCGYIHTGDEPPETCPVCGVGAEMFSELTEDEQAEEETAAAAAEQKPAQEPEQDAEVSGQTRRWKCTVCGYIHSGEEPPEKCPACGAGKEFFTLLDGVQQSPSPAGDEAAKGSDDPLAEVDGFLPRIIVDNHLHPIMVHTPNGVMPMAVVFLVLAMIFGYVPLERASFFSLIFVLISMPAVILTGYFVWQMRYKGVMTPVFRTKFICAGVVSIILLVMICVRAFGGEILAVGTGGRVLYLVLGLVAVALIGIAGHLGGKMVFEK